VRGSDVSSPDEILYDTPCYPVPFYKAVGLRTCSELILEIKGGQEFVNLLLR